MGPLDFLSSVSPLSVSFLCSVMEAVLLTAPISYLNMKENQGVKAASILRNQKQNIDKPIAAILSLNTIAHTKPRSIRCGRAGNRYFSEMPISELYRQF